MDDMLECVCIPESALLWQSGCADVGHSCDGEK